MAGSQTFSSSSFLGWIDLLQSADPAICGQLARVGFGISYIEIVYAQLNQRLDRFLDDQGDQIIGGVVASRSLPRENIWADDNFAAIADDLVFDQALIDRAELLNAEIAIVDVAAAIGSLFKRKHIDDVGHNVIGDPYVGEQRYALAVEKPAVVRRQTDGGIAFIDSPAEIVDDRPVSGSARREDVIVIFAVPDVAAYLLAQRVVVVTRVTDGKQIAVLRIQNEQEAVEKNQGGLTHVRQGRFRSGSGNGTGKFWEDLLEDQSGKTGRNPFLVKPAFLNGALVERPWVSRPSKESFAPKDEHEHLQPVIPLGFGEGEQAVIVSREIKKRCEIDFEKLLRNRPGALIVEPPPGAIGENAPAEFAGGQVIHTPKIAKHLGRWRGLLSPSPGAAVQWTPPALRLDDCEAELIALPVLSKTVRAVFSRVIREQ